MLENKLTEAKAKKETLKARAASAKTSKQIQEMIGSLNTSNSSVAFDKMEEKVRRAAAAGWSWAAGQARRSGEPCPPARAAWRPAATTPCTAAACRRRRRRRQPSPPPPAPARR